MVYNPQDIRKIELFRGLSSGQQLDLFDLSHRHTFDPGHPIIQEGEKRNSFFVIVRGSVRVTKKIEGEDRELAVLSSGEIFGEMALLEGYPRFASVTTMAPTIVLEFRMQDLVKLFEKNRDIAHLVYFNLARSLSQKLRHFGENIKEITFDWV